MQSCQGNFASGVQKLAPSVAFANVDSRTGLHSLGMQKSRPWRRLASVFEKRPFSGWSITLDDPLFGGYHPLMVSATTSIAESLFSGVQQRLLALFFGQPDRSFYNNELLRLTGTGKGALQRELERLVSAGVVTATRIGNQAHYQANRAAPIFEEIRGIVIKTFGLADVLRAALADLAERIELAFIFGSVAKGTDTAASDIDVMVVAEDLAYADLFERLGPAEAALGRKVNPTLYTPEEVARRQREDNHFITRVLEQPKIFLIGGDVSQTEPNKALLLL